MVRYSVLRLCKVYGVMVYVYCVLRIAFRVLAESKAKMAKSKPSEAGLWLHSSPPVFSPRPGVSVTWSCSPHVWCQTQTGYISCAGRSKHEEVRAHLQKWKDGGKTRSTAKQPLMEKRGMVNMAKYAAGCRLMLFRVQSIIVRL